MHKRRAQLAEVGDRAAGLPQELSDRVVAFLCGRLSPGADLYDFDIVPTEQAGTIVAYREIGAAGRRSGWKFPVIRNLDPTLQDDLEAALMRGSAAVRRLPERQARFMAHANRGLTFIAYGSGGIRTGTVGGLAPSRPRGLPHARRSCIGARPRTSRRRSARRTSRGAPAREPDPPHHVVPAVAA
jgi:hypothetical protein